MSSDGRTPFSVVSQFVRSAHLAYQRNVDRTTPHLGMRWLACVVLFGAFCLRILACQGFFVVAYALGIYLLNIFLLFLSPRFDPALAEEDEAGLANSADLASDLGIGVLPVKGDEEFRPFIRRLPEFKFWYNATRAILIGLACTGFRALDIPVFWPILLMYFVFLFALTMRRQIQHMIRYRYVPFDIGKKSYSSPSK